uniref:mannose-6-phosphate isomerase n=1 Tax=Tabanus bromius TaxID=304241 RepID=A0A0K8TMD1_TABBR
MEIVGSVKNYEWGKLGLDSEVAQLAKLNSEDVQVDDSTPYAELWMGDHPSGPSTLKSTGSSLAEILSRSDEKLIGDHTKLSFLFKVLSIRKALSIQIHPNKEEAEKLHASAPDIYKDSNHKPELAIALTPFLALCGFRPYKEIHDVCQQITPIKDLIGHELVKNLANNGYEALKECYSKLMAVDADNIKRSIEKIRLENRKELQLLELDSLFNRLNDDFPNDVGVLSIFFLNVIELNEGQAIFLPANEPHAYLEGNCIECMACSDNVIRAGLTPKFKDVSTLLRMVNYKSGSSSSKLFQPKILDKYTELFAPSVEDFAVIKICIPPTEPQYILKNKGNGAILLVLKGQSVLSPGTLPSLSLKRGSIVFIPGNCGDLRFDLTDNKSEYFVAYQAMPNCYQ